MVLAMYQIDHNGGTKFRVLLYPINLNSPTLSTLRTPRRSEVRLFSSNQPHGGTQGLPAERDNQPGKQQNPW